MGKSLRIINSKYSNLQTGAIGNQMVKKRTLLLIAGIVAAYDSSGNELTTEEGTAQSFTVYVKASEIEDMNKAINYGEIHIYQK